MGDKYFIEVILGLFACIVALLAFIWNSHMKQHHEINGILRDLADTKKVCINMFAKQADFSELSGRVTAMESKKAAH